MLRWVKFKHSYSLKVSISFLWGYELLKGRDDASKVPSKSLSQQKKSLIIIIIIIHRFITIKMGKRIKRFTLRTTNWNRNFIQFRCFTQHLHTGYCVGAIDNSKQKRLYLPSWSLVSLHLALCPSQTNPSRDPKIIFKI